MIFCIYGTDHYRCQEKLDELKNSFIQKKDKSGVNIVHLEYIEKTRGKKSEGHDENFLDNLKQEALATSFLGDKKLIIVKNALKDKKDEEAIITFLKNNEATIENSLCFIDLIERPKSKKDYPPKSALFHYLSGQKFKWEFTELSDNDALRWIKNYCQEKNIAIANDAVSELFFLVGNDTPALINEIKKLSAYSNKNIDLASVKLLVNNRLDDDIFALADAIGQKNRQRAWLLTANQLRQGDHPLQILTMISRQFNILFKIKSGATTGMNDWILNKNRGQANNFSVEQIKKILGDIMDLEIRFKRDAGDPELLFDVFIANNC